MIAILSFEREQKNGTVYPVGQSEGTAAMTHRNTDPDTLVGNESYQSSLHLFLGKYIFVVMIVDKYSVI